MNADQAIALMRSPRQMHIICIDVTNKCDLACSNCTRLLENQDQHWDMSPENFRLALRSLKDYYGIIAMIGGNPVMHRNFEELCKIFVEEVPEKLQRGIWTNNYFKHEQLVKDTFGVFNLNAHGESRAIDNLKQLADYAHTHGAIAWNYAGHSDHAPILTAMRDLFEPSVMWDKITQCDINREWSASIVENRGELRAYFCEVAAAFDLARNQDHGMPVTPGWWRKPIQDFGDQIRHFCPGCGVPAKLAAHKDHEETDTYTESNADLATKAKKRKIIMIKSQDMQQLNHKVTQYNTI